MLPDFIIDDSTVQDHIHLGYAYRDGRSPVGFGSMGEPPYLFKARRRVPEYDLTGVFRRGFKGHPHDHVLLDSEKKALTFKNYIYDLRVTSQELDILAALKGNRTYLIDNRHCSDNSDHSGFVKLMFFQDLSYNEHMEPSLNLNLVTIRLIDMYTLAPENI